MARLFDWLSVFLVPLVIFYIVGYGILQKRPVFQDFIEGGKRGLAIVVQIAPTMIGLFVAIGILRNSGTLDFICELCKPIAQKVHIPVELMPVGIIKLFSSSGANGLLFDLFKQYGTDSFLGMSASILLSCTETLFYTISIYFMSIGIRKTGWVIPVGSLIMLVGLFASVGIAAFLVN